MGDALFVHGGVTSAMEARLDLAGLLALDGPGPLDARTGVLHGPGTTTLVSGTASTAPMRVSLAPHHWVTTRGAANGPYLGTLEAAQLLDVAAAPASGSRTDVVYVKQGDATPGVPTPDAATAPVYGVVTGTVGAGEPALPVGAGRVATITVSAGATRTDGAGVVITNTARQTVARGARVPVRSAAERDALTRFAGLEVYRLDTGAVELCPSASGTTWLTLYDPAITGRWVTVFEGDSSYSQAVTVSSTTLPGCSGSVVVPAGRQLEIDLQLPRVNVPSGGGVFARLVVDGSVKRTAAVQTSSSPSTAGAWPLYLNATLDGTGASVAISGNVYGLGNLGTVQGSGDAFPSSGPLFRYKIV